MSRRTDKVSCPSCGSLLSRVVDSRGPVRLRRCDGCGQAYVTGEYVTGRPVRVTSLHPSDLAQYLDGPAK